MFSGGEDISALVLDIGSHTTKSGYAGEDKPKVVFNSVAGIIQEENLKFIDNEKMDVGEENINKIPPRKHYVGNNALSVRRDHLEIVSLFDKNGLIDNIDILEKIWDYAFSESLKLETKEHPVLQSEHFYNTNKLREKLAEVAFEKFSVPGFFLSKSPVLSCFMSGKHSGLCVEFGHNFTSIVPVHEGYALKNASLRSLVGGKLLSEELQVEIKKKGIKINPHYTVRKNEVFLPKYTSPSYLQYSIDCILDDIKESSFKFSDSPFDEEYYSKMPGAEFELPDKKKINLGSFIYKCPEMILNPKLLTTYDQIETENTTDLSPLSELVSTSVGKCHSDMHKEMYGSIILCGGTSLIPGLQERLQKELGSRGQKQKPKFIASNYRSERKYSSWIGGSILASLGTFQQLWMSKSEFHENGSAFIIKKCP
eukprot:TRINITY_DN3837_c0_g1_i1.p1 TRINITY_DN3837_c0_g1~~TRINITY_DN3837_c0_g1_i1.p1  ORF type:complete len:425 (+),score=118.33 TRINITY_DN3837_c0_g1_i1:18-1292(+)